MSKVITIEEAVDKVKDGMTIAIGGFSGVGVPLKCVEKIVEKGVKNLTLISVVNCNPFANGDFDIAPLFVNKQVKRFITAHNGTSPHAMAQEADGSLAVEFFPMGSWIEKLRAGGAGLGGVLTPTGVGTLVEEGKEKLNIGGKDYILELPLRADIAFIKGYRADTLGNIEYRYCAANSNIVLATAADYTVAEVNEIVEAGQIEPERVGTQCVFVNSIVKGYDLEEQQKIYEKLWVSGGILKV